MGDAVCADAAPWLGKTGLGVSIALLLIGGILIGVGTQKQGPFTASPLQLISATGLVVLVSALAFRFKKNGASGPGAAPGPWIVGIATFLLGLGFMSAHAVLHDWTVVGAYAALYSVAIVLLAMWSA